MKKKVFLSCLLVLVLMATMLSGCGAKQEKNAAPAAQAPAPKVIELKLAHQWPANNFVETELVARWIKEIEAATNGRVKITSYPGETLCKTAETYESVVQGVADIGISVYSYNAGRFPVVEAFMTPGITEFANATSAGYALNEGIKLLNPKELQDTKQLFSFSTGPSGIISKKPIRNLADIKGVPIGVTSADRAKVMQLLDATPISLPLPEWYEALSKGLMAGGIVVPEALKGHRLYEVSGDYITVSPLMSSAFFYCVMNLKTWNSLPPDIQAVFAKVPDYFVTAWDIKNKEALEFARTKKPVEVIYLTDEETAKWKSRISTIEADSAKRLKDRGLPAEEIQKTVKELMIKYNNLYKDKL